MHSVVELQSAMPSTLQDSYSEKGLESNPNNSVHDDHMAVVKTSVQDHKLSAADPVESHVHHGALYRSVKPTQVAVMIQSPSSCLKTFGIEARDLCYKTPNSDGIVGGCMWRKGDGLVDSGSLILKNVNLEAKPGEILAIMGPSGAGKSTLLEVLAGRIRPSSPPHSILINNQTMSVPFFRRISGYVPQDDALFPLLTVKETLTFSANLRLSSSVPQSEKEERVRSLMHELGLMHVADSRIGNEDIRGISGGERRRVSIGVDVIHDPAVLLLDEPTSGLDSAAALHVVEMLHCMAKTRSRTIILSIHQPGFRILQLINSFLLLANGSVAHHGSLERLQNRLVQAGHKIPAQMNVLEFAIDAMASSSGLQLSISPPPPANLTVQLKDLFLPPPVCQDIESGCFHVQVSNDFDAGMLDTKPTFANNSAREIIVLARRFRRNMFRTHELFAARTTQALVAGFALGSLYINSSSNQEGIMMRLGFFAFSLTFLLSATVEALPIFLQERHVLIRETSRGAYRISSYLIANLLVFIPFFLLLALLYSIPVYWLVGLSNASPAFFFFVFVIWLVLLTANSFVAFFSALAPNYIVGNSMISGCMGAFFLFSGYFISEQNMPPYWRFMHYISLFKYPLDALLINEYSSLGGKCLGIQYGDACTVTSDTVLQQLGLKDTCKWQNVAVMIAFTFFYQFLCYIVLRFKVCKRKR